MIVNQAIQIALNFTHQIITDPPPTDLRLEEVEKRGDDWLVTVSYIRPGQLGAQLAGALGESGNFRRDYRVIKIDGSGNFVSLKNRYEGSPSVS